MSLSSLRSLVGETGLRGAAWSFGAPDDVGEAAGATDPTLLRFVEEPYDSVADAADRLSALEATLRERGDRRAVFLTIYSRVTAAVDRGLEAGAFDDPDWVADYLVAFADRYRAAFRGYERGYLNRVPAPWTMAFGAALDDSTLVIQDAALGVNAHVTHDLAFALRDVGIDPDRSAKYADHVAVNRVLRSLVDPTQELLAELYAPGLADLDAAFGDLDEAVSFLTLREAREHAWRGAVALTDVRLPIVASLIPRYLRLTATGAARLMLGPALSPDAMSTLRAIEDREPVLDRLAATLDASPPSFEPA